MLKVLKVNDISPEKLYENYIFGINIVLKEIKKSVFESIDNILDPYLFVLILEVFEEYQEEVEAFKYNKVMLELENDIKRLENANKALENGIKELKDIEPYIKMSKKDLNKLSNSDKNTLKINLSKNNLSNNNLKNFEEKLKEYREKLTIVRNKLSNIDRMNFILEKGNNIKIKKNFFQKLVYENHKEKSADKKDEAGSKLENYVKKLKNLEDKIEKEIKRINRL